MVGEVFGSISMLCVEENTEDECLCMFNLQPSLVPTTITLKSTSPPTSQLQISTTLLHKSTLHSSLLMQSLFKVRCGVVVY